MSSRSMRAVSVSVCLCACVALIAFLSHMSLIFECVDGEMIFGKSFQQARREALEKPPAFPRVVLSNGM